jgi:hypothetical protein
VGIEVVKVDLCRMGRREEIEQRPPPQDRGLDHLPQISERGRLRHGDRQRLGGAGRIPELDALDIILPRLDGHAGGLAQGVDEAKDQRPLAPRQAIEPDFILGRAGPVRAAHDAGTRGLPGPVGDVVAPAKSPL